MNNPFAARQLNKRNPASHVPAVKPQNAGFGET